MSHHRHPAPESQQPKTFNFNAENREKVETIIAKYPQGREQSAVMPLLMLAQRQHQNWLPRVAIEHVAEICNMPFIRAYEVATFYTMYNLAPIGKYHVQCCTTTPCWLRGSDEVVRACQEELGIGFGQTTADGMFTLAEVECLGACVNAPMVEITTAEWDEFFEDLTYDNTRRMLQRLKRGDVPKPGSQSGRVSSEPRKELTSLVHQSEAWEKKKRAI